jgi:hypothetical protein
VRFLSNITVPSGGSETLAGMTAGSVLFAGTGGLVSQDNANLSWLSGVFTVGGAVVKLNSGSTAAEQWQLGGRVGVGIPVPYYTPTANNTPVAFDIWPKGTPTDFNSLTGVAWIDVCSTDIAADGTNYESLRMGKMSGGFSHVSSAKGGTGTVRDLILQLNGGSVGIGPDTTPNANLHVNGAASAVSVLVTNTQADSLAQVVIQNDARFYSLRINTDDTFAIRDGTAGADRFTIDTTGAAALAGSLTLAGNVLPDGLSLTNSRPTLSQTIPANYTALVTGLPLRVPASVILTVAAGGLLRITP